MELIETPFSVSLLPCRVAPSEFTTASDGTISLLEGPMGFFAGWLIASSAHASCGAQNKPATTKAAQAIRFNVMKVLLLSGCETWRFRRRENSADLRHVMRELEGWYSLCNR